MNYPSDFYVTTATVIPVLFLALVVQGRTYEEMAKATARYLSQLRSAMASNSGLRVWVLQWVSILFFILTLSLVSFPVIAEIEGLLTLGSGKETGGQRGFVMAVTIYLFVVVAIPPLANFFRTLYSAVGSWEKANNQKELGANTEKQAIDVEPKLHIEPDSADPPVGRKPHRKDGASETDKENGC
jgi:hypothetical protein